MGLVGNTYTKRTTCGRCQVSELIRVCLRRLQFSSAHLATFLFQPFVFSYICLSSSLSIFRHRRVCRARDASRRLVGIPPMSEARPKLMWNYHYRCNGELLVRSELRRDFCCSWCSMYTGDLAGLICHLACSHSQYQFTCGGTIAVRVLQGWQNASWSRFSSRCCCF